MTHILAADPDETTLALLEMFAKRLKVEISVATDGAGALVIARRVRPDMMLLSLELEPGSGIEAMRQARKDPVLAGTPILAMVAYDTPIDPLIEAGFSGFLLRPVTRSDLRGALGRYAGHTEPA